MQTPSRRQSLVVGAILLCCLSLCTPSLSAQSGEQGSTTSNPCTGTITRPVNGTTVVAVQGYSWVGGGKKRDAKLVAIGPNGTVKWVHHTADHGMVWGYDVDPMPNGDLFVTGTMNGKTVVYEFNPRTQKHVWKQTLNIDDTHDIDLINNGTQLLVANLRNYNKDKKRNDDSVFIYDLKKDKIVWRWYFRNHYPKDTADHAYKNYTNDWTHVNNVQKVRKGEYLVSARNFDQAIFINRSTKKIDMQLGEDGNPSILNKQHNPDYLESKDGKPTVLVADSDNNRMVEYQKEGDSWNRTWSLGKGDDLSWPRDADRLPNGDTLLGDSKHERVMQVTPTGKVVWEFYTPWLVYDVERIGTGDESHGPTMADINKTGSYKIKGAADKYDPKSMKQCNAYLNSIHGWAKGQKPKNTTTSNNSNDGGVQDSPDDNGGNANLSNHDDKNKKSGSSLPGFGITVSIAGLLVAAALLVWKEE